MKRSLDFVAEKVAGLGVPGLVLIVVISMGGLTGGAAIVAALAALGGPFGMMGGLVVLGILVLISNALAEWGIDKVFEAVLNKLKQDGMSKDSIHAKLNGYWFLSAKRKERLKDLIHKWY